MANASSGTTILANKLMPTSGTQGYDGIAETAKSDGTLYIRIHHSSGLAHKLHFSVSVGKSYYTLFIIL